MTMPWLRLWDRTLDLSKAQRLDGETFKGWINLLMLANRQDARGSLPCNEEIAFALRIKPRESLALTNRLRESGFIDTIDGILVMHDWDQWQPNEQTNAERARKWREEQKKRAHGERTASAQPSAQRTRSPSAPELDTETEKKEEEKNRLSSVRPVAPPASVRRPKFQSSADLKPATSDDPMLARIAAEEERLRRANGHL